MKKLLLATLLALGVTDAAYASQFVRPWFEGQYYCKFTNAGGYFNVRFSTKVVANPPTCKNGYCSTNGYSQKISASVFLNLWVKPYWADKVITGSDYVRLYMDAADGRLHVRLTKPNRGGKVQGVYISGKGKAYPLVCTKG
jgi:hypothetical protein